MKIYILTKNNKIVYSTDSFLLAFSKWVDDLSIDWEIVEILNFDTPIHNTIRKGIYR